MHLKQKHCSAVLQSGSAPEAMPVGVWTGRRVRSCVLLGKKLSKDREPGDKGKFFSTGEGTAGLYGLGAGVVSLLGGFPAPMV